MGKVEITPEEVSRTTKAQKRELYAAAAARSAAHREVEQYEDDNVGAQALNEGEKTAEGAGHYTRSCYARRLKKRAKLQAGKKKTRTEKTAASDESKRTSTAEGEVHWFSCWKQRQKIRKSYYAAAQSSGTAAQAAGSGKAASGSASAARSGIEQVADKGRPAVSAAVNGIANFAKGNAHALVVVGVFLLLLLLVMSAFSSCSILFSGTTHVSGQTIYTAEDRDIRSAEQVYKKLEKELDKKIKRTPQDHPGYNEYQYHLDPIEHDPWQLTSFLTTLYDDYTRSEAQSKLKEIFKKQYKLTTYLSMIRDLYDRSIVAYRTGTSQTINLVLDTIHLAMKSVKTESRRELHLHSDQGFQYTSQAYFDLTKEYGILPSMSRRGNCYDNALAENFFGILKTECIYRHKPETFEEANKMIDDYIYFYNHERIQLKTGLSPLSLHQYG